MNKINPPLIDRYLIKNNNRSWFGFDYTVEVHNTTYRYLFIAEERRFYLHLKDTFQPVDHYLLYDFNTRELKTDLR